MDVLAMNFPSNNFDVIIDKGTIDSIIVRNTDDYFNKHHVNNTLF